jgi:hypothetical protein
MASPEKVVRLNLDASKFQSTLEGLIKALGAATQGLNAALKDVTSQINDIASQGSKKLAEGVGGGVSAGVDEAKKSLDDLKGSIEETNQAIADRFELQVKNTVTQWSAQFEKLGALAKQRFSELQAQRGLMFNESSLVKTNPETETRFEDPFLKGEFNRILDLAKAYEEVAKAKEISHGKAIALTDKELEAERNLAAAELRDQRDLALEVEQVHGKALDFRNKEIQKAREQAAAELASQRDLALEIERVHARALPARLKEIKTLEDAEVKKLDKVEADQRRVWAQENAAHAAAIKMIAGEEAAAVKAHNDEVRKLIGIHENIGTSISKWVIQLGAGIVFYRAIRDTVREIETLLTSFVGLGITHTKNQEKDLESLTGILSANYTITDLQGKQLDGASRLSAVQDKASSLYKQIQSAAKETAFTTEEFIQAFQQITEPAVRYKKTTDDILQLTLMTSSAARALGLSMKEAGTELAALLSGKGGGNKLATGLGITAGEIDLLKQLQLSPNGMAQAGAMWDRILDRMTGFAAQNANANQSLASIQNRFTLIMGELSAGVEAPFFEAFKEFVRTAEQFLASDDAKTFFSVLKGSGQGVLNTLNSTGRSIAGGGAGVDGLSGFVIGVGKLLELLVQLFGFIARVTKNTVEWIGANQLLLQVLGTLFAIYAGGMGLVGLEKSIASVAQGTSAFAGIVNKLVGFLIPAEMTLKQVTAADEMLAVGSTSAATGVELLSFAFRGLVSATIIGSVVMFFGLILEKITDVIQSARLAKQAMQEMASGDLDAATQTSLGKFHTQIGKGDGVSAADAAFQLSSIADERQKNLDEKFSVYNNSLSLHASNATEAYKELIARQREYDSELSKSKTQEEADRLRKLGLEAGRAAQDLKEAVNNVAEARRTATKTSSQALGLIGPELSEDDVKFAEQRAKAGGLDGQQYTSGEQKLGLTMENRRIDNLVRVAKQLQADQNKNRDGLLAAQELLDGIEARSSSEVPKPGAPDIKYEKQSFKDPYEDHVAAYKSMLAVEAKEDELAVAKNDMLQSAFTARQEERERQLTLFILEETKERQKHFEEWQKTNAGLPVDHRVDPETIKQLQERFDKEAAQGIDSATIASLNSNIGLEKRKAAFNALLDQYSDSISAKEDEVTGRVGDKAADQFQKMIDKLQAMTPATPDQEAARQEALARARGLQPRIEAHAQNESALRNDDSILKRLTDQERLLGQAFASNRLSASAYAAELTRLQQAQRSQLLTEQSHLLQKRGELMSATDGQVNQSALDEVDQRLAQILAKLELIPNMGDKILAVFHSWAGVLGAVASYSTLFDGFGKGLSTVTGELSNIVQKSAQFVTVMDQIKGAQGAFDIFKQAGGGAAGIGALFGSVGGAKDGAQATGLQKAMGALSIVGTAASIGIGVASALFQHAVEKAKTNITDGIKKISDAIANGSTTLGDGVAQMEKAKADAIAKYSSSKSGRAALKDIIPDLDKQIADLQAKVKQIRDSFDQKLQDSTMGSGPFSDFAHMLMDLAKTSKDYLDTFEKDTEAYAKAKEAINELYNNTLDAAKQNLQQQMNSFESEALASAEKLIGLLDQRNDLFDQLASLADQQASLEDQRAKLATDEARTARDLAKERADNAQKVLDLEKNISDVIRKAADDEAQIRQRGVLEAQETIAQQKARDISNVRNTANDQVTNLEKQLRELLDPTAYNEKLADTLKAFQDRTAELDKQAIALDKQNNKIQQQLGLNQIDIETAQTIAGIEGRIFNISGDRFELEARRGRLEVDNANIQVQRWSDVQGLIRSIIDTGSGVIFTPPPGFPQIRVQIGDIIIDNKDQSQNQITVPGGGSSAPPSSGGGGGGNGDPNPNTDDYYRYGYNPI